VWSQRRFSGAVVKAGWTARFPGAAVKDGRTTWFPSASTWRRSKALTWRRICGGGRAVEADVEDAEEERVCGGEMAGLGFRGLDTLKKKNTSDKHDATYELSMPVATVVMPVATYF
jgi:hypothetical protein